MAVQVSPVVDGACGPVLGRVAGRALHVRASERLYGSLLGLRGAFPVDHEDKVGPHA